MRRGNSCHRPAAHGFALFELVFIIVLLGILVVMAVPKFADAGLVTMPVQAEAAADLVRRGQSLALARGKRTRIRVPHTSPTANGVVLLEVCDVNGGACSEVDRFTAQQNVVVGPLANPIVFDTQGQPLVPDGSPATVDLGFSLSMSYVDTSAPVVPGTLPELTTKTISVNVAALTGRAYLGT